MILGDNDRQPIISGRVLARFAPALVAVAATVLLAPSAQAAVAVVSNRTPEPLVLAVAVDDGTPRGLTLAPGDSRPIFGLRKLAVSWPGGGEQSQAELTPGCAYFFCRTEEPTAAVKFEQIGLNEQPGPPLILPGDGLLQVAVPTLRVKALVDDDELRRPESWQPALRQRLAAASAIIEAHCGVRLQLVGFGRWDGDDAEQDFERSFAEFEREVPAAPADVAIGFASQYAVQRGRFHMGGTKAPLYSHILLKERVRGVLETERLELVVHELGHLLGASHSPEPTSVMRPLLTGGLQRAAGARVQFDPVNTLAMSLVADEMRLRRIRSIGEATELTRRRLAQIYAALDPTLPDDPAAGGYQQLVSSAAGGPILADARKIIAAVEQVAKYKDQAPLPTPTAADGSEVPKGDRLLNWYVRQAAVAGLRVKRDHAEKAFLLAMGALLDRDGSLDRVPLVVNIERHLSGESDRDRRRDLLGESTMRGRADLAKHFFVSAHLVVIVGSDPARGAGLLKELSDAHGGSGFSFADMTANRSGIVFAQALLLKRISLEQIARDFTGDAYLPAVDGLTEGLQAPALAEQFGDLNDPRLQGELAKIEARVGALPVYSGGAKAP